MSAGLAGATLSVQAGLTTVATTGSWDGNPPGTLATVMQTLLNDPSYDVNAAANRVQDSGPINDQTWTVPGILGATGSASASLLLEIAGNAGINSFGIYNLTTKATLQVFAGSASGVSTATMTFSDGTATVGGLSLYVGSDFGFYLQTAGGPTWYSQQSLNNGDDHMVTLKTTTTRNLDLSASGLGGWALPQVNGQDKTETWNPNEYLLGWEDLALSGGDDDYQDMLVKVCAVPVPETSTVVAGALLLLPFGFSTLRILRKSRVA